MARCEWCRKKFIPARNKRGEQRYCSKKCRAQAYNAKRREMYRTSPMVRAKVKWRREHRTGNASMTPEEREAEQDRRTRQAFAALGKRGKVLALIFAGAPMEEVERKWLDG